MNNNIKLAIVVEVVQSLIVNGDSFRQESAEVVIYSNAKEALAAFEAAEGATAMIVISADMNEEVRKDLGLARVAGWPWFQAKGEGVAFWEGRAQWYHSEPMTWTMKKGHISSKSWRAGFVALMRAAW